jgi:CIC family chloride channel protein
VNSFLQDGWEWRALLVVLAAKLVATLATVGSGAMGGVFTPTLFTGAGLGYLLGLPLHALWPAGTAEPSAYALVGMAAFLAGTTQAPLMAMMIVFEMTLDYGTVLPLMLACVAAHFTAAGCGGRSIYRHARAGKESALELGERSVGELVRPDPVHVGENATFSTLVDYFRRHRHAYVHVTDAQGRYRGAVALHDIKEHLNEPALAELLIASELLHEDIPTAHEDDSLPHALQLFLGFDGERLPVVARGSEPRLIGTLAKNDLLLSLAEMHRIA